MTNNPQTTTTNFEATANRIVHGPYRSQAALKQLIMEALADAFGAGKQEGWNDRKELGDVR